LGWCSGCGWCWFWLVVAGQVGGSPDEVGEDVPGVFDGGGWGGERAEVDGGGCPGGLVGDVKGERLEQIPELDRVDGGGPRGRLQ
jgi:hypothetical protein